MKRTLIINILFLLFLLPAAAQINQQGLKREVTLYNPYKPSLTDTRKRSFLPDIMDTSKVRPDFKYNIETVPYSPEYTISPIKAASLIPDPLAKLYKSYLKLGFGNYITPLAELSITNERSKKGAIGIIARHYSTNGKLKLDNDKRVFAGYMDNDVSLFGKRFLKGNYLEGSVDFMQKVRYAYGYDTSISGYDPSNKEIRFPYQDAGARVSFGSLTLDSTSFSYNFGLSYDLFFTSGNRYQHNVGLTGTMAKMYKGFYAGADLEFQYYKPSAIIYSEGKYIASISPFLKKSTQQWSFKAGVQLLLDKNMNSAVVFHLYPDARFSFAIVPSYVSFFAGLNGRLERNDPKHIIDINPYLVSDTLFKLVNTSNALAVSAGLKGNTGIGGNYLISASYSIVNDMLFYTSAVYPLNVPTALMGNTFIPMTDDGEIFTLHGEINGLINDKISYSGKANLYKYTLSHYDRPWNMPLWDIKADVAYNLRDKIIGNADLTIVGKRPLAATSSGIFEPNIPVADSPAHMNLNLGAEYRYTKILSFWVKLNNISYNRYYEWAWYPSQRFLFMAGFTYSL
jgi:hypothetical protein